MAWRVVSSSPPFDLVSLVHSARLGLSGQSGASGAASAGAGAGAVSDAAAAAPAPRDPFAGVLVQFLQCMSCPPATALASMRHDTFVSATLPLVTRGGGGGGGGGAGSEPAVDLHLLLRALTYTERVTDVRCVACSLNTTLQQASGMCCTAVGDGAMGG